MLSYGVCDSLGVFVVGSVVGVWHDSTTTVFQLLQHTPKHSSTASVALDDKYSGRGGLMRPELA
jgi:hypothetical protein